MFPIHRQCTKRHAMTLFNELNFYTTSRDIFYSLNCNPSRKLQSWSGRWHQDPIKLNRIQSEFPSPPTPLYSIHLNHQLTLFYMYNCNVLNVVTKIRAHVKTFACWCARSFGNVGKSMNVYFDLTDFICLILKIPSVFYAWMDTAKLCFWCSKYAMFDVWLQIENIAL